MVWLAHQQKDLQKGKRKKRKEKPPLQSWVGPNCKNPPKTNKQLVKLTDYYVLKQFEYEVHAMTGNGSYDYLLKLAWKNL